MKTDNDMHIMTYKKLFLVLVTLLLLTGITLGISYIDLGKLNVWISLLIASSKATFVILFFMHLRYESRVITLSFISTIIFLGILISFTFFDVAFR
jgi:cytochrome c oxidase subunit 4